MANLLVIGFTVGLCLLVAAVLRSLQWLADRAEARDQAQQRTPADVLADAAEHRARRIAEQAADEDDFDISDAELADVLAIWSDDMHKQQREEGR